MKDSIKKKGKMVTKNDPHMVTGGPEEIRNNPHMTTAQEEIPYCSPITSSGKHKRRALQVNINFAVRVPLRQLKQTSFCWPLNNWRRTPIRSKSITILAESRNCQNLSQRRFLHLTENQRNLSCLNIYSKRV